MDVEVVRDEYRGRKKFDATEIANRQPGFRYRLANKNSHRRAQLERQGYVLVQANDPEHLTVTSATPLKQGENISTVQEYQDLVLMKIPVDIHKANVADPVRDLNRRRRGMHERKFLRETRGPGGQLVGFQPSEKGQDYKSGMDEDQFDKKNK